VLGAPSEGGVPVCGLFCGWGVGGCGGLHIFSLRVGGSPPSPFGCPRVPSPITPAVSNRDATVRQVGIARRAALRTLARLLAFLVSKRSEILKPYSLASFPVRLRHV
jgi:hypothetical protein